MSVIEFAGVRKDYGSRTALDTMDLALPKGAALGLLGPNGAGKTTALRLILGMAHPSAGQVVVQGWDPLDPEARQGLGYLPERLGLPAHMSVGRYIALHALLAGVAQEDVNAEVDRVIELTGLTDRRSDRIGVLSKGLAQRVGFAQALIGDPKLLLLDEPSSGLDPIGMRQARDWISSAQDRGCTVLISSHLLSEVERLCDRIMVLKEGRVVAQGSIEEVVREGEELEDAFVRLIEPLEGAGGNR
ncbi:ABC transporter ATP-binding protein [Myxococcota bacterium]|nr:ABC transporter ATP-binding protein [Myxococcota bacterium]